MIRTLFYVIVALNLLYAVAFLLNRKYRSAEMLWLPLCCLGAAVELAALAFRPPLHNALFLLAGVLVIGGIVYSNRAKKSRLARTPPGM